MNTNAVQTSATRESVSGDVRVPRGAWLLLAVLFVRLVVTQVMWALGVPKPWPMYTYLILGYPLLALIALWERERLEAFFLSKRRLGHWILLGLALGVALHAVYAVQEGGTLSANATLRFLAAYPSRLLGAALCEELMFRAFGLGYLLLLGLRPSWALLLISALFTAGHLRYAAEGRWGFLCMMLAGSLIWGWLTLRTKNIATTTVLHGFENSPNLFVL